MSDTNRVKISRVREPAFGVTPDNPVFHEMRVTSGGLTYTPNTVTSNEIRSDRQVSDLILVGAAAAGQLGFEVSYGSEDEVLEAALFSGWDAKPLIVNSAADTEITGITNSTDTFALGATVNGTKFKPNMLVQSDGFTNAGNNLVFKVVSSTSASIVGAGLSLTDEAAPPKGATLQVVGFQGNSADIVAVADGLTSTSADFTTFNLGDGQWVKVGGAGATDKFTTPANNSWSRIAPGGLSAHKITFDIRAAGWVADIGTGKTIKIFTGDVLRNGATELPDTIERQYLDHNPITYEYFLGMDVNQLDISLDAQAVMTMQATYIGKTSSIQDSGRIVGATDIPAPTNSVLNTSSNVGSIAEDGAEVTGPNYVLGAKISINNNLRARQAIGVLGAVSIGQGEFNVTGSLNTYFGNKDLYEKVISNEKSSYSVRVTRPDADNQTIVFDLPRLKYSGGSPAVPGKNQDVMAELAFQAFRHEDLGYTMQVQRFPYIEV